MDEEPRHPHHVPHTWHDADMDTQEFQSLLRKYPAYQDAVDAWMRGERCA